METEQLKIKKQLSDQEKRKKFEAASNHVFKKYDKSLKALSKN
ncbi:hypothetical protein SH601_14960 [Gracilibacillus sp. S3-1-1]|uniref:Uncharacterized protein n=1 Tax=Gracilibacillus pellucidus TaxID=3095368 RepID=A0ACC6M8S5_9BACI|nr:hypothetical protein [Gracilibacillus sp. S3-1-1]MDX8047268.1 hypothetical protein [Gracilibacillus sp. S3-1-1]